MSGLWIQVGSLLGGLLDRHVIDRTGASVAEAKSGCEAEVELFVVLLVRWVLGTVLRLLAVVHVGSHCHGVGGHSGHGV